MALHKNNSVFALRFLFAGNVFHTIQGLFLGKQRTFYVFFEIREEFLVKSRSELIGGRTKDPNNREMMNGDGI